MARAVRGAGTMNCLSCNATDPGDKWRRGLCQTCYQRAYAVGLHRNYPACGRRPVPYQQYSFHGEREPGYVVRARERGWKREMARVARFERNGWNRQREERVA